MTPMSARTCAVCDASLEGRRKDAVYCSDVCRKKAHAEEPVELDFEPSTRDEMLARMRAQARAGRISAIRYLIDHPEDDDTKPLTAAEQIARRRYGD